MATCTQAEGHNLIATREAFRAATLAAEKEAAGVRFTARLVHPASQYIEIIDTDRNGELVDAAMFTFEWGNIVINALNAFASSGNLLPGQCATELCSALSNQSRANLEEWIRVLSFPVDMRVNALKLAAFDAGEKA